MEHQTLTGKYQSNYVGELANNGRELLIADGNCLYCYPFPLPDTLDDALDDFVASYEYNEEGPEARDIPVDLIAEEYCNGVLIDSAFLTINAQPSRS